MITYILVPLPARAYIQGSLLQERLPSLHPVPVSLPVAYSESERSMHPGLEDFRRFFGVQGKFDNETLKKVTAAYYGMISYLDENIGKLMATLDKTGLSQNTRVIYSSDHGESMGQKGMFSKCIMYEESVGIPMILSGPDLPKGQEIDTPTQLMDIFPTILEATGVTQKDEDILMIQTRPMVDPSFLMLLLLARL